MAKLTCLGEEVREVKKRKMREKKGREGAVGYRSVGDGRQQVAVSMVQELLLLAQLTLRMSTALQNCLTLPKPSLTNITNTLTPPLPPKCCIRQPGDPHPKSPLTNITATQLWTWSACITEENTAHSIQPAQLSSVGRVEMCWRVCACV